MSCARALVPRRMSGPLALIVIGALLATLVKLWWAASSYGTNDVMYWSEFARTVARVGPLHVYGHRFSAVYNHPPLAGWMLVALNGLHSLGFDFSTLIRVPASLADLGTALLVYGLLSRRRTPREAVLVALAVVWSPLLLMVSGYHGNTDPVFVMLVLASVYLLADRRLPLAAGVAIGLAVSVKLVPVVVLPWLAWTAWRHGRRAFVRFSVGGALVFLVLWVPVLLLEYADFRDQVILYRGIPLREWGLSELFAAYGWDDGLRFVGGPGSLVVLGLASASPFVLRRGRHLDEDSLAAAGVGLALVAFLALSPAFGMQYLTWALAPAYLLAPRLGHVYNVCASAFAFTVYRSWNHGLPPWHWDVGLGRPFDRVQLLWMAATWASLLVLVAVSLAGVRRAPERAGIGRARLSSVEPVETPRVQLGSRT